MFGEPKITSIFEKFSDMTEALIEWLENQELSVV